MPFWRPTRFNRRTTFDQKLQPFVIAEPFGIRAHVQNNVTHSVGISSCADPRGNLPFLSISAKFCATQRMSMDTPLLTPLIFSANSSYPTFSTDLIDVIQIVKCVNLSVIGAIKHSADYTTHSLLVRPLASTRCCSSQLQRLLLDPHFLIDRSTASATTNVGNKSAFCSPSCAAFNLMLPSTIFFFSSSESLDLILSTIYSRLLPILHRTFRQIAPER